ncbi:MAG: SusC/RagA family protein [Chitinophagaceae bacterium]
MDPRKLLRIISLPVFLLLSMIAFAQNRVITGRVTDASGNGIPGASITVAGSSVGTTTNATGDFTLSVPANAQTLVATSVGYERRELPISGNTVSFILSNQTSSLSEVVVIGYGTRQRRDLTGSVTSITSKDFNRGQVTTPEQLIAGKVAGVQITSNGGAPGAGSTIRIRGGASLSASNDPLIVIDGVPIDNTSLSGSANALSLINPNDIESFNILKDASATAIYGSRASNGVIIITTKKGRSGKPTFQFNTQLSASTNSKHVDVLSADQLRSVLAKNTTSQGAAARALLGTANIDWQNEIYQTAYAEDNNLSVSGTAGPLPYRVSIGFLNQDGILKTGNLKRTTSSINLSPTFLDNHLKINLSLKGALSKNVFANEDAIGAALVFDPTHAVMSGNNRFGGYFEWVDPNTNKPNVNAPRNPLGLLYQKQDKSDVKRSIGNVQVDYKLHFFPDLHANLNVGYDIAQGKGTVYWPDSAASRYARGGENNQYRQDKQSKLLESYLSYNKEIKSIRSRIEAVAGYGYQDYLTTNYFFADYNAAGVKQPNSDPKFDLDKPQNTLISFFGRLNYNFADRYILQASFRRDGSSRIAPENRWENYPAVAFAWRLKQESFLKNVNAISELKFRIGYGITGQQEGIGNYSYLGLYTLSTSTAQYQFGNNFYTMYRPNGYNPNLKWEKTETYNGGIDFGFANNRIIGSIDYYFKKTRDLLNNISQPAGSNFSNVITANVGNMENKGVEFNLTAIPVQSRNFTWTANFNITYNQNTITNLTAVTDPNYPGVQYGTIEGGINNTALINSVGYGRGSFYVYQQVYDGNGKPIEGLYVDRNGDGIINEKDLYQFHNADPSVFLGFSSNISYKQWTAGFTLRGSYGNYLYNNVYSNLGTFRNVYNLPYIVNNASVNYLETGFNNNQYLSDYYVQNASFLRMDNIYLGYNFGKFMNKRVGLGVNASVQNVFVITKYQGVDPEINGGIDYKFYPRPRVYSLGISLNF